MYIIHRDLQAYSQANKPILGHTSLFLPWSTRSLEAGEQRTVFESQMLPLKDEGMCNKGRLHGQPVHPKFLVLDPSCDKEGIQELHSATQLAKHAKGMWEAMGVN